MILIIDNYDSFTYNLYQIVAKNAYVKVVRHDHLTLDDIEHFNPLGIMISPGPKKPQDAGICIELIQKLKGRSPLLGICLGHQALAESFKGKAVYAEEVVHGKETLIFHSRKNLFKGLPLPFKAGRYHSLIVEKESLPACFSIEAETKEGVIMAIKHNKYPYFGFQFHPESILTPKGNKLIDAFLIFCEKYHGIKRSH